VPGVTAGVGATAYAGIPVTHRAAASAVAFVTGHGDPEAGPSPDNGHPAKPRLDWLALAKFPGTLVVYMGVTHLAAICRTLVKGGKAPATPCAVVQSGCLPSQRVAEGTLETIAEVVMKQKVRPPALLVVGDVVSHRESLAWYESLPLFGQRILVTRPADEAAAASTLLESLGAEVLLAPMVEIKPLADFGPLDEAIDRLASYQWLVFTSSNGVRHFLNRIFERGRDARALGHLKLAAIGPGTAKALAAYHLRADLVPEEFRSESLAEALSRAAAGQRVLLARADRGRTVLKDVLGQVADVDQVAVYRNVDAEALPVEILRRIEVGTIDWITLTSSAITARLHSLLPETARRQVDTAIRLASLSPITSEAATALGWTVAAEAEVFTWEGLVEAMIAWSAASPPVSTRALGS
jgi:uroporphyrinogen III methyltransferase/synthase